VEERPTNYWLRYEAANGTCEPNERRPLFLKSELEKVGRAIAVQTVRQTSEVIRDTYPSSTVQVICEPAIATLSVNRSHVESRRLPGGVRERCEPLLDVVKLESVFTRRPRDEGNATCDGGGSSLTVGIMVVVSQEPRKTEQATAYEDGSCSELSEFPLEAAATTFLILSTSPRI